MSENSGLSAPLGAGSYDYEQLYGNVEKVLDLPEDERRAAVEKAVSESDRSKVVSSDPRETPGYKLKTVTGESGFKETIQVPDEKQLEQQAEEATPAPKTARRSTQEEGSK